MDDALARWQSPVRPSRTRHVEIRGLRYCLREWGRPDATPMVLLHGARDASATFQFLVDAMANDQYVVAPDWRGHGASDWTPGNYWLSDFIGDLDVLFDNLFADSHAILVGHSMGANVAGAFAGLRPDRVSRLILLDALGNMLDQSPVAIVATLLRLLDMSRDEGARAFASIAAMAERLQAANVRLTAPQATFLAEAMARPLPDGDFAFSKDPTFRRSFPTLHNSAEWGQCWARIAAPVLCLFSSDPRPQAVNGNPAELSRRTASFRSIALATIEGTGHNLHHDAPHAVARAIEAFLHGEGDRVEAAPEPVIQSGDIA